MKHTQQWSTDRVVCACDTLNEESRSIHHFSISKDRESERVRECVCAYVCVCVRERERDVLYLEA